MCSDENKPDVLVLAESAAGEIDSIVPQLIVKAQELAKNWGGSIDALLLGAELEKPARTLAQMRVKRVHIVDDPRIKYYNPQLYARIITEAVRQIRPAVFLLGYTYIGMAMAPAVAARLDCPLFPNCLDVELKEERVQVVRPIYTGLMHARVEGKRGAPVVVSLQRGAVAVADPPRGQGTIRPFPLEIPVDLPMRAIDVLAAVEEERDLRQAEVIVTAGRGIKEKANLRLIEELARSLGGMVACSRPLVDLGWLPLSYQIGISGKTVRPKVYVACGISGAIQHVTAILGSQVIIAINSDPHAPIFRVAKYGIVGDLFKIIPVLISKAKERNVGKN